MDGISVIICAHDSAERIRPTIEALACCRANFPVEMSITIQATKPPGAPEKHGTHAAMIALGS